MELNWLPDHQAVQEISGTSGHLLIGERACTAITDQPGLVPAAIDPEAEEVIWADVGENPLQEWQFLFSLQKIAQKDGQLRTIRTRLDELTHTKTAAEDIVPPVGFIFHMSRCGSTLLGNALSGTPKHLVINQPGPLQDGFWTYLTKGWTTVPSSDGTIGTSRDIEVFQDLLHLILRRRRQDYHHGFIKFRSWAVLFLPFIRRAFPDVPCLFLYRDPREVVGSTIQKQNVAVFAIERQRAFLAGCAESELEGLTELDFMQRCYINYFNSVIGSKNDDIHLLNYNRLGPDALSLLLSNVFSLTTGEDDLALMQEQFRYYSKDPQANRKAFDAARDRKAKIAKAEKALGQINDQLADLYVVLNQSPRNLFPEGRG